MAKYHIRKDGTVGVCKATKHACPLGENSHFDSEEIANRVAQKMMELQSNETELAQTSNKSKEMRRLQPIIRDIDKAGGKVFYVGGFVRDEIMGIESKDIDVEIHGISVEDTSKILSKYGSVDKVGESFGVLMVKGLDIDFAFPRTERQTGDKHTDFEVKVDPFMDYKEAARRRDLTMGAIMKDAVTGEIHDYYGGQEDIKNKVIRMVDRETFVEDPLRALRAAQFASRFGMKVDDEIIEVSKGMDYTNLSKERVTVEIEKGLMSDNPSVAFRTMEKMGVVKQLFPEISALRETKQSPIHHPEGDVFEHTMNVMDMASKVKDESSNPKGFMYAALLHDIGKPRTTVVQEDGRVTAHDHEEAGEEMIPFVMKRFTDEKANVSYVRSMTRNHMRAHKITEMRASKVRRLMTEVPFKDIALLNIADSAPFVTSVNNAKKLSNFDEKMKVGMDLASGSEEFKIKPFIQGRDLIDMGAKPGKYFGSIIDDAFELQLNGQSKEHIERAVRKRIDEFL